ncbi:MAG: universal stress protein [Polyangiaceae bacterium]
MSHVSHKLSGPVQGALAGGGDPATSPLYVFGPFLKLLVLGGALEVSFGASIWLAVLTVVTASAMYRLVMKWVTDGSGGSGLSEEEFGPWAVKLNASITVIEYTLTFLVSIAALVTFAADRIPSLAANFFGIEARVYLAVTLSVLVGVLVNRGPKTAARAFGPATAAVLLLLWLMIFATVWKQGLHLPDFRLAAFSGKNVGFTLGGYSRILALMTGVEIFANLVAAYDGPPRVRSRRAFGSLMIVMGTTVITMLVVGPAIRDVADPLDPKVSVFTQAMDRLLPSPISYLGTLIGIAVLLSAAAASAQGLQNLALGLRYRHYIPALVGQRNRFGVADKPVWLEVLVCAVCFVLFGTAEETYLSLYAAGVFVLLSLTGWAAVKRLLREVKGALTVRGAASLVGTLLGVLLTSAATVVIFSERFLEGAWAYALLVPGLFFALSRFRRRLGSPPNSAETLGRIVSASPLQAFELEFEARSSRANAAKAFDSILVPLDLSAEAEHALGVAQVLAQRFDSALTVFTVVESASDPDGEVQGYLDGVAAQLLPSARSVNTRVLRGAASEGIGLLARHDQVGAVVMTMHQRPSFQRWLSAGVLSQVLYQTTPPVIVLRPGASWRSARTAFAHLLVTLDGSSVAEQSVPFVLELATAFQSRVTLISVLEGSESEEFSGQLSEYLARIADSLEKRGLKAAQVTRTGGAVSTIVAFAEEDRVDLIIMVSHGTGGLARQDKVKLGSVTDGVMQAAPCPVFMVSALAPSADSS